MELNPQILIDIQTKTMPYGKYKGVVIMRLPIAYLEWMLRKGGFPKGSLGMWLSTAYEIKLNGLESLLPKV
jgi:uncharacterized protein